MPITLIEQNPSFDKKVDGENKLAIAEMFAQTLQGEGVYAGVQAVFLRLQGCTLKCVWCDTLDVWPNGNEYTFQEIFALWEEYNVIGAFRNGFHLVLTGGSPCKQQKMLERFLTAFHTKYNFTPFIEIENEAVLQPTPFMKGVVNCWNNSPKLANSNMKERVRLKPDLLRELSLLRNSWFKFVVSSEDDWREIERDFMPHIRKDQIILMPEGQTQEELNAKREFVAELALRENVRFSDRMHVTIWDKKTGV